MPANHLSEPLLERGINGDDGETVDVAYRPNNHHSHQHTHQRHYSSSNDSLLDLEGGGGVQLREGVGLDRNANQIDRASKKVWN